jgi:hypothetical protein
MIYPASPAPRTIKITSETPALISVTRNLRRQSRTVGSHKWSFDLVYPRMSREDFAPLWAFTISQKGRFGTFPFIPPIYGKTSGGATGTLAVGGGYAVGISTITTTGLSGTLKSGDFIKFENHSKVYMITSDGSTTLKFEPALIAAVASGDLIDYKTVEFTVALDDKEQVMVVDNNGFTQYSVKLTEVF